MVVDDAFLLHVSLFEVMNKTEVDVLATIRMTKEQNALVEDLIAWVGARLVGAQVRGGEERWCEGRNNSIDADHKIFITVQFSKLIPTFILFFIFILNACVIYGLCDVYTA